MSTNTLLLCIMLTNQSCEQLFIEDIEATDIEESSISILKQRNCTKKFHIFLMKMFVPGNNKPHPHWQHI